MDFAKKKVCGFKIEADPPVFRATHTGLRAAVVLNIDGRFCVHIETKLEERIRKGRICPTAEDFAALLASVREEAVAIWVAQGDEGKKRYLTKI